MNCHTGKSGTSVYMMSEKGQINLRPERSETKC